MSKVLEELQARLDGLDTERDALLAELRAFHLSSMNAPAYVNVPAIPVTDAQIDALAAQEGAG